MKKWKQILSTVLAGVMLLSTSVTASAETSYNAAETAIMEAPLYQSGAVSSYSSATLGISEKPSIEQCMYEGFLHGDESVDVSAYKIPWTDAGQAELKQHFSHVINTSPDLFHVENRYGLISDDRVYITSIQPTYTVTGTELAQQRATYNEKMQEILNQVDRNWTDLEKIVFLHDYLAQNFVYDSSYSIHDAYNFLTKGTGVCQAYTLTYLGLLKELGIDSDVASSDAMNHIWNIVELNGKWYHVDVTWDDPVPDNYGSANHHNLLLSDTAIASVRGGSSQTHHDWVANDTCTDTTYDSYFWSQFSTPFKQLGGNWYTIGFDNTAKAGFLYSCNLASQTATPVYSLGQWTVPGSNSYWTSSFSGLDVYDSKLYFNSAKSIISYDPSKSGDDAATTVCTPNTVKSIYGMQIKGSTVYYNLKTQAGDTNDIQTYALPAIPEPPVPTEPLSPGDIDNDKRITLNDAFLALKGILGIATLSDVQKEAADVDGVTGVTLDDVRLILRVALGIDALAV